MRQKNSGFVLMVSLLLLAGLATMSTVGLMRSTTELVATTRYVGTQRAFHLAEAGLDRAISAYGMPESMPESIQDDLRWVPSDLDGDAQLDDKQRTLTDVPGTEVDVQIFDWAAAQSRVVVSAFIPNQATPSATRRIEAILQLQDAAVQRSYALEAVGAWVFGEPLLETVGSPQVDSYDSRQGPYGGSNVLAGQALLVNRTPNPTGITELSETTRISGDAILPNGSLWFEVVTGSGTRTCDVGDICLPAPDPRVIEGSIRGDPVSPYQNPSVPQPLQDLSAGPTSTPPPLCPGGTAETTILPDAAYGHLVVSNAGCTVKLVGGSSPLQPTRYRFYEMRVFKGRVIVPPYTQIYLDHDPTIGSYTSLRVDSGGAMTVQGKTEIYFHDRVDFGAKAIANATGRPSDLALYGVDKIFASAMPTVVLGWSFDEFGPSLVGTIATDGTGLVYLNGASQVFGAISAARAVLTDTSKLHYDVALRDGDRIGQLGVARIRILSWRECSDNNCAAP